MSVLTYVRRVVTGQYEHKEAKFELNPEEHGMPHETAAQHVRGIVHATLGLIEGEVKQVVAAVETVAGAPAPLPVPPAPVVAAPAPLPSAPVTPVAPVVAPPATPPSLPPVTTQASGTPAPLPTGPIAPTNVSPSEPARIVVPEWNEANVLAILSAAAGRLNAAGKPGNTLVMGAITKYSDSQPPKATRIPEQHRAAFMAELDALS